MRGLRLVLYAGPTAEPLTAAEVRAQLQMGQSAGEPAPVAPTLALLSPAAAGNCGVGAWRLGYTFVTPDGETELGTLSAAATVADPSVDGQLKATGVPLGGAFVTARKGYLLAPGASVAKYAGTINDNTTTEQTFNIAAGSLGVEAPSTNTTEDPRLLALIQSVREGAEGPQGARLAVMPQTWDCYGDAFEEIVNDDNEIVVPIRPVRAISGITYVDPDGATQTLSSSLYVVRNASERTRKTVIALAYNQAWPAIRYQPNAIKITVSAGYASAAAVPALLRQAMLAHAASLDLNRAGGPIPDASLAVYKQFRSW